MQPWGRVLVLPQGIHIIISLNSLQNQNSTTNVSILHSRETLQIKGTTETHQITRDQFKGVQAHTLILSAIPSLNYCCKTHHLMLLGWDTVCEGHESSLSLFAWLILLYLQVSNYIYYHWVGCHTCNLLKPLCLPTLVLVPFFNCLPGLSITEP